MENNLMDSEASNNIKELIDLGWELRLHFGNHESYCDIKESNWEASFTKFLPKGLETSFTKFLPKGLWDNHKDEYSLDMSDSIKKAYLNVKNGVRVGEND